MKSLFLPTLLVLTILSCNSLSKKEIEKTLIGNSYEWQIFKTDTSIVQEVHFLKDSTYILVWGDGQEIYAQSGNWFVKEGFFSNILHFQTPFDEWQKIKSVTDSSIHLTFENIEISASRIEEKKTLRPNHLLGTWIAPKDSIMGTIPHFDKTGEYLTNPVFTFSTDSIKVRIDGLILGRPYRISSGKEIVILSRKHNTAWLNKTILINSIDSINMNLRLSDDMGDWKDYELIRIDSGDIWREYLYP